MTFPAYIRALAVLIAVSWLGACTSTESTGSARQKLATKPVEKISTKASARMYVRTTAYHHSEPGGRVTAVGGYLRPTHSAAADWSWLPAGTRFRIVETGDEYLIEDYGSALVGRYTIDIYKSTRAAMNAWGVRYVHIQILQMGSYPVSLAVLKPRQKYSHVRRMVVELQKKVRK